MVDVEKTLVAGFQIDGKVQKSGFRSKIRDLAIDHNLFGFAENLKNYRRSVLVVCKGHVSDIEAFQHDVQDLIIRKDKFVETKENGICLARRFLL